jgi:hypothetical protein
MGKISGKESFLVSAKARWGWFIKKSPAFIVLSSLTVVSVFGLGVGGTLAATGVIPNPFASSASENLESSLGNDSEDDSGVYFDENEAPSDSYFNWSENQWSTTRGEWLPGSSWTQLGTSETLSYRWTYTHFHVMYSGTCPNEELDVFGSAPNFGYLSDVVYRPEAPDNGIYGLSQYEILGVAKQSNNQTNCKTSNGLFVGSMKCYNFNEVWIWTETTGRTQVLELQKIPIPESVVKVDCPPGAEKNDPTRYTAGWDLNNYPQAVVTPPTRTSPPIVVPGQYMPPSSQVPTEPSPTPTTDPSPTPTTEPSPTPTTEPSPSPSGP